MMPEDNAALSANTVDVQDLCSLGMDRAIGIEKRKPSWFAPVGELFKAAAQALGFCMEMRRSWLSQLAPHVLAQREMEKRRSPLVSIPPLRGGDFQGIGVYRSDDVLRTMHSARA